MHITYRHTNGCALRVRLDACFSTTAQCNRTGYIKKNIERNANAPICLHQERVLIFGWLNFSVLVMHFFVLHFCCAAKVIPTAV